MACKGGGLHAGMEGGTAVGSSTKLDSHFRGAGPLKASCKRRTGGELFPRIMMAIAGNQVLS